MEPFGVINNSISLSETVNELAFESYTIFPDIDALTMRKTFMVVALVLVSVGNFLSSPAMLQEILETPFISLPCACFMNSFSFNYAFLPFSHIAISFWRAPHADSMSFAGHPLTRVELTVVPFELTLSIFFPFLETPNVGASLANLIALYFQIMHPSAFEKISFPDFYSETFPFSIRILTKVQSLSSKVDNKIYFFDQFYNIDAYVSRPITLYEFCQLLFCRKMDVTLLMCICRIYRYSILILIVLKFVPHGCEISFPF